jgi:hypothetical protein
MPIHEVRSPNNSDEQPQDTKPPGASKPVSPGAFSNPGTVKRSDADTPARKTWFSEKRR